MLHSRLLKVRVCIISFSIQETFKRSYSKLNGYLNRNLTGHTIGCFKANKLVTTKQLAYTIDNLDLAPDAEIPHIHSALLQRRIYSIPHQGKLA